MAEPTGKMRKDSERFGETSPAAKGVTGEAQRHAPDVLPLNRDLAHRLQLATAQVQALNQELDDFTYSVSHDLRAPLRHVSGFSKLLADEFGPNMPDEARGLLTRILQGTERMGDLIDDLVRLAAVGRHELHLQTAGIEAIVQEALADLGPQWEGRNVQWELGDLPVLECDAEMIRQVFLDLLGNALKFTRPRTEAVIEVGQTADAGTPVLFVRDNGVGFNMKYAGKLFGAFQRLHRAEDFEGTGVGLATAHRIIRKHGGRIWAVAQPDQGATFCFTLSGAGQNEVCAKDAADASATH